MAGRMTKEEIEQRRQAREQAFCIVFEQAVSGDSIDDILHAAEEVREFFSTGESKEVWEQVPHPFAEEESFGVEERREEIDKIVVDNIRGWSITRLSKVTLALLRLAVYEILFDSSIPASVSINEAVELAKKYGGKDDAPYINGVLASVVKAGEGGKDQ